ncbi:MAG: aspartate-semialdehyde dehydrogenase [Candidatus Dormibacteria bacterium]
MKRYRVGILGATGVVGQRLVQLLHNHPWFDLEELVASERSSGRPYGEVVSWHAPVPVPARAAALVVKPLAPDLECDFVLSALDAKVAGKAETSFAAAGYPVVTNARQHRLDGDVPLLIPEVNPDHLAILPHQRSLRHYTSGLLATNPNCSAVGLALVLKPLQDAFGIIEVSVVTMQALSGAGIQGVSAMTILDNVLPHIPGEEGKVETESAKILGDLADNHFVFSDMRISAQCNRVAVADGHTEAVSVRLKRTASAEELHQALADFSAEPQRLQLPTAPPHPIQVFTVPDRPQPLLDREASRGMTVSVGNIRPCAVLDWKFTVLVHNAVRGAAGAALLNAELLATQGYLDR